MELTYISVIGLLYHIIYKIIHCLFGHYSSIHKLNLCFGIFTHICVRCLGSLSWLSIVTHSSYNHARVSSFSRHFHIRPCIHLFSDLKTPRLPVSTSSVQK